ncbi:MAG: hypothetical protein KKB20_10420 [Proteobacteria bacterium]|nr:hypothetical protein [Pseudomonadota bacterium]
MCNLIICDEIKHTEELINRTLQEVSMSGCQLCICPSEEEKIGFPVSFFMSRVLVPYLIKDSIFKINIDIKWDYYIGLSPYYCSLINDFKTYFTFLLGHELGHILICENDINLQVFHAIIRSCFEQYPKVPEFLKRLTSIDTHLLRAD